MSSRDTSFLFPIAKLETSRLRLVEFDLDDHGPAFVEGIKDHPSLFDYVTFGPLKTMDDLNDFLDARIYSSNNSILFAVMVKANSSDQSESLAGTIGYHNSSAVNCVAEIGFITILPKYQGSFVAKTATGLLIMHALDPPPSGLGLRRCEWQSHASNEASKRFATKMLFTYEGTKRFERTMPIGKVGNGYDTSTMTDVFGRTMGPSRDTVIFAHYCDEWAEKRQKLLEVMNRQ